MINRILIRIKVLQIVYSYYQNGNRDLKTAENELLFSLQKSYDLYHYFLLLIVELTNLQSQLLEAKKSKFLPSYEDLNPNMKFVNNRFAAKLSENEALMKYASEQGLSWSNDTTFVRQLLDLILESDLYKEYMTSSENDFDADKEFWRATFKKIICNEEKVNEFFEEKSIYWNDDIYIVETFVLKTIKSFTEESTTTTPLLPMFRDNEDRNFALQLFKKTLLNGEEYRSRIESHLKNWELERVANMDMIIMQIAIAEIITFPTIPTTVTLNEYIDISKAYSTPKSASFINGILDTIVNELKKEKLILKD